MIIMKCSVCHKEFGNGERCQHCGTDRFTGLANYHGFPPADNNGAGIDYYNSGERTMVCYACGKVIPADSKFCPVCSKSLFVKCPKCGHEYSSQYPSCNQCGTNREKYEEEFSNKTNELELKITYPQYPFTGMVLRYNDFDLSRMTGEKCELSFPYMIGVWNPKMEEYIDNDGIINNTFYYKGYKLTGYIEGHLWKVRCKEGTIVNITTYYYDNKNNKIADSFNRKGRLTFDYTKYDLNLKDSLLDCLRSKYISEKGLVSWVINDLKTIKNERISL